MLHSAFSIPIKRKQICFYPGEILDEISHTWRSISPATTIDSHLLEDLINLIDMVVEHFKSNIEPSLPENRDSPYPFLLRSLRPPKHIKYNVTELDAVKSELRDYKSKVTNQSKMITELTRNVDTSNRRFDDLSGMVQGILSTFHRHGIEQRQQSSETPLSDLPSPTPMPHVPKNLPARRHDEIKLDLEDYPAER